MKKTTPWLLAAATLIAPILGLLVARTVAARRLRRDVQRLFAAAAGAPVQTYHETQLAGLPAPVQRYFRHVLRDGQPYLRGLRLRHGGQFKTDLKKDWMAIEGEQYITADPPGFIWQGTTRQFVARDEFVAGRGRLDVRLLGAVPIAGGTGPAYDQGELLRWLVESTWLPTALLPGHHLAWTAINDHSARLTLTHRGRSVSCLARFNERGEMAECEAPRQMDAATQWPWLARFEQYRRWHGVLIPTVGEASWVVNGQRQSYARFVVRELDYEPLRPF
ncbi:DUF6544 family protein [Hymenobacter sp.]|uniref:DUF6544 family protein n=1 Tax=Hymenobacter sp. TaxID=1898978 RepID=UPI00286A6E5E|nr:DUF6544 family protein [Hymenobacter sp.]